MDKIQFSDSKVVLVCAFRYALGRRTYVVSTLVEEILNNWELLDNHTKNLMKREIVEHKELFGNLGMSCDEDEWKKILDKEG